MPVSYLLVFFLFTFSLLCFVLLIDFRTLKIPLIHHRFLGIPFQIFIGAILDLFKIILVVIRYSFNPVKLSLPILINLFIYKIEIFTGNEMYCVRLTPFLIIIINNYYYYYIYILLFYLPQTHQIINYVFFKDIINSYNH